MNRYEMILGGSSKKEESNIEVSHIDDKLKPKYHEEIVTLKYGPRHNIKVVVNKESLQERYTDNTYSEYGRTQYWHTYVRDNCVQKTLVYKKTEFHDFQPYKTMDDHDLKALETDLGYIQSQAGL